MDKTSVITLIVVSIAILLPIIYFRLRSKIKKQKIENEFRAKAQEQGLKISTLETWNQYAIGIDKESAKVLYMKSAPESKETLFVDLKTIKAVEILEFSNAIDTKSRSSRVIEQLMLKAIPYNKENQAISLEFYNYQHDPVLADELQVATKWKKIIASTLNSNK